MCFSLFLISEEAGALEYYVYVVLSPGDLGGVFLSIDLYRVAGYGNAVFSICHSGLVEAALCCIILQEVRQHVWLGKVVNSYYLNAFHIINLAESKTADAAKAIDGHFYIAHKRVREILREGKACR